MTTRRDSLAARPGPRPLSELAAAVSFLTRLRIRGGKAAPDRPGAGAFASVGAAIGVAAAVPIVVLGPRLPLPAAVLAVLVIAVVSGGLHLDGLGDTADALAAPTPDAAERARADPHAGAASVVAIALDLFLGVSLLAAIAAADPGLAAAALVVAGCGSRAAAPMAAWAIRIRGSGRQLGLGGWFTTGVGAPDVAAAIATTVLVAGITTVLIGSSAVWLGAGAGLLVAALSSAAIVAWRGQLDGDGYGAVVETTFICILGGIAVQLPTS